MNKMILTLVVIIVTLICVNIAWGLSNNMLETPKYTLLSKSGSFEIRKYEPMIIARTVVKSEYRSATSTGFRRIANYIFGGNEENMDIAMTAPVISNSPLDSNNEYEISFVMPSEYSIEKLPQPIGSDVEIIDRSLELVACISFGGWATDSRAQKYHAKLSEWIKKEGLSVLGKFMVAQYNSPWALPPFRHNEIMVRLVK